MQITDSKFIKSVADSNKLVEDAFKQVAFVGRSNVGKSSLINMLCVNKKLARTSSTPGRTRLINYFLINNSFYLVDLPGYGYAKASKVEVDSWQSLLEPYLLNNDKLKCVCVLVDSRINPTELDKQMINFLCYYNIPFIVIATKCDKIPKSKVKPEMLKLANKLGLGKDNIFPSSSDSSMGRVEILNKINTYLSE